LWGWLAGCFVAWAFVMLSGRKVIPLSPSPAIESL
jgi:hypothetical protein